MKSSNKVSILPAILALSEKEFRNKVEKVRSLGEMLHVDVMDGQFVPNTTWAPPDRMKEILGDLSFEAHLMVANPEQAVPQWFKSGANRVFFHAEATENEREIAASCGDDVKKLGIAINPETPVSRITTILDTLSFVMIMGVNPGKSGQPFQDVAKEKIAELRKMKPGLIISVDGGVKPYTCAGLRDAGADLIVAGSALTDAADPKAALEQFKQILRI